MIVYHLDRLARKVSLIHLLEKEFKKRGVKIHCIQIHYDKPGLAYLLKQMRASTTEYARALIVERVSQGKWSKERVQ